MDKVRVVAGPLRLKGTRSKLSKNQKHKSKPNLQSDSESNHTAQPTKAPTKWKHVCDIESIVGPVFFKACTGGLLKAFDNGKFSVGSDPFNDDGDYIPDNTELFNIVVISENRIAIKSPFNRYLGIDASGLVTGRSEASGVREQFEPVFQDGNLALIACNQRFITISSGQDTLASDGEVIATSETAVDREIFTLFCTKNTEKKINELETELLERDVIQIEKSYVKQFQSFQGKNKLSSQHVNSLYNAQKMGQLHTALLDRRSKMKSDKFCK